MSLLGQSQSYRNVRGMSALPLIATRIADIARRSVRGNHSCIAKLLMLVARNGAQTDRKLNALLRGNLVGLPQAMVRGETGAMVRTRGPCRDGRLQVIRPCQRRQSGPPSTVTGRISRGYFFMARSRRIA